MIQGTSASGFSPGGRLSRQQVAGGVYGRQNLGEKQDCKAKSLLGLAAHFREAGAMQKCLHVWSGPRCLSTSLMYSFAQRSDTEVMKRRDLDRDCRTEPLHNEAHCLKYTVFAGRR